MENDLNEGKIGMEMKKKETKERRTENVIEFLLDHLKFLFLVCIWYSMLFRNKPKMYC